jgi:hypothetical protein
VWSGLRTWRLVVSTSVNESRLGSIRVASKNSLSQVRNSLLTQNLISYTIGERKTSSPMRGRVAFVIQGINDGVEQEDVASPT